MFRWVNILRIVLVLIVIFFLIYFWEDLQGYDPREIIEEPPGMLSVTFIVLGLFISKSVLFMLPVKLIYISAGMLLPLYLALPINLLGIGLEMTLTYFYGYFLGRDAVMNLVSRYKKFAKIIEFSADKDVTLAFTLRLAPVAIEPVSLVFGAGCYNFQRYIFASLAGLLPKLIFFTLIGYVIVNPLDIYVILSFLIAVLVWGFFVWRYREKLEILK